MSGEVLKDLFDSDMLNDIKDETTQELLKEKEEIEKSEEINAFEKWRKKLLIDIKLKLLWHSEDDKDSKEEDSENPSTEVVDTYDTNKKLLFISKVKENQEAFSNKVKEIAQKLEINPNRLMQIMNKESWLNHQAVNKDTNATGLIQFMPETAKGLGTSIAALKNMTNIEQLDYVLKYYEKFKNKIESHTDLYLATFYPAALGKPDNYIIGSENGNAAIIGKQNRMNNGNPISIGHLKNWISKDIPNEYLAQFQNTKTEQNIA